MNLTELFDYKNQFMKDMVTNSSIVNLLTDDADTRLHPERLAYTQIHPYEYVPETVESGQTFICYDVDIQRSYNKSYYAPALYVWVFTHKSKLRLTGGGVRTDTLASEIAKAINGSRYYGLGELELYSLKRFAPTTDFQGKVMTFVMTETNLVGAAKKPVPSNRRAGV